MIRVPPRLSTQIWNRKENVSLYKEIIIIRKEGKRKENIASYKLSSKSHRLYDKDGS